MQIEVEPQHLPYVTMSMRVISSGDGYRYLLRSVAAGDGNRDLSTPLTRYYHEKGTPPGFWLGSGVGDLGVVGKAQLAPGDTVTEQQLQRLLGAGLDPLTGQPLGRAYPQYKTRQERVDRLDQRQSVDERAAAEAAIEEEETKRGSRRAVAGYDFTFSVPKSVSALWAVADAGTQAVISAIIWEGETPAAGSAEDLRNQISASLQQARSDDEQARAKAIRHLVSAWAELQPSGDTSEASSDQADEVTEDDIRIELAERLAHAPEATPRHAPGPGDLLGLVRCTAHAWSRSERRRTGLA